MKFEEIMKMENRVSIDENYWLREYPNPPDLSYPPDGFFIKWTLTKNGNITREFILPNGCPPVVDFDDTNKHIPFRIKNNKVINLGLNVANFEEPFSDSIFYISNGKIVNTGGIVANFEEPFSSAIFGIYKKDDEYRFINTGNGVANFEEPFNYNNWSYRTYYDDEYELCSGQDMETFGAFSNTTSINEITIPNNINSLEEESFTRSELEKAILKNPDIEYSKHTFPKNIIIET